VLHVHWHRIAYSVLMVPLRFYSLTTSSDSSVEMPGARRRRRPRTAWMDNINTWTGLPVEESIRMTGGQR